MSLILDCTLRDGVIILIGSLMMTWLKKWSSV